MHALGWTLLYFCWQGAVVAVVLWCVLEVLGERRSRVRYAASFLALGMMVALPLATFAHLVSAGARSGPRLTALWCRSMQGWCCRLGRV